MTPLDNVLSRLEGVKWGRENHSARCPAHADKHASLSIREANDGKVLVHCHAGCDVGSIVGAVGLTISDLFPNERRNGTEKKPDWHPFKDGIRVANYPYIEDGVERFVKERWEPRPGHSLYGTGVKNFYQKHHNPEHPKARKDGYAPGRNGYPGILWKVDEVREASALGNEVWVVEGEKDVLAASALGIVATCNADGASRGDQKPKWNPDIHCPPLKGSHVVMFCDNDVAGRVHAKFAAHSLVGIAASVKLLPALGEKPTYDLRDFIRDGGTLEELRAMIDATPSLTPEDVAKEQPDEPEEQSGGEGADEEKDRRPAVAARLIKLVEDSGAVLSHDAKGRCYITIREKETQQTFRLDSEETVEWLARSFWIKERKSVSTKARDEVLSVLSGMARWEGKERIVAVRVAEIDTDAGPRVFIDLGDSTWRVVEVYPDTWSIISASACPVLFVRRCGSLPMPEPVSTGPEVFADFAELMGLKPTEPGFRLVVFFCLQALRGRGDYPILQMEGQQGSGKSTAAEFIRMLVDPNTAALRPLPSCDRDAYIACANSHVQIYDNVSGVNAAQSDRLCRISSGSSFATRSLYSDDGEALFTVCNPIVINGINGVAERADLAERCLTVRFRHVPPEKRKYKKAMLLVFEKMRPALLGALLDGMAGGLKGLPSTTLERRPRLADFARYCVASERALGMEPGAFFGAFDGSRLELIAATIEGDEIAELIVALLRKGRFKGSASELKGALETQAGYGKDKRPPRSWPKSPSALRRRLNRLAPSLREVGITVEEDQDVETRTKVIHMEDTGQKEETTSNTKKNAVQAVHAVQDDEKQPAQSAIDASSPNGIGDTNGIAETANGIKNAKPLAENSPEDAKKGDTNGPNGPNGISENLLVSGEPEPSGDDAVLTPEEIEAQFDSYPAEERKD